MKKKTIELQIIFPDELEEDMENVAQRVRQLREELLSPLKIL